MITDHIESPSTRTNRGFEFPQYICLHCAFWRIIAIVLLAFLIT